MKVAMPKPKPDPITVRIIYRNSQSPVVKKFAPTEAGHCWATAYVGPPICPASSGVIVLAVCVLSITGGVWEFTVVVLPIIKNRLKTIPVANRVMKNRFRYIVFLR